MYDIIMVRPSLCLPRGRQGGVRMKTTNAGFTLVELLVVIALIALLAMLLVPGFQGMAARARIVQCANHLKRIGQAVEGRRATAGGVEKLDSHGWPGQLVKYLGKEGSLILECPSADGIPEGGGVHKPLNEFACIAYHGAHTNRREFVESGIMAKASQSQYEKYGNNMKNVWLSKEGYVDDGSGVIYWGYEDQGEGGDDYQDVLIKVTQTPDGRSRLECKSETSGKPCVWDTKNDVALVHYDEFNYWYGDPPRQWKSKTVYIETGHGTGSNYAMNADTVGEDRIGKILAMDYIWVLARSTDNWGNGESFDTDDDGTLDFARHEGWLNVLFVGGEVRLMHPDEVDPSNVTIEKGYWLP